MASMASASASEIGSYTFSYARTRPMKSSRAACRSASVVAFL